MSTPGQEPSAAMKEYIIAQMKISQDKKYR